VGNGLGRGFNSPRLHQNPLTAADNPLSCVFWLAHLLLGLGVLALGWGWTRPSVPMGRVMRRLRRLLWLSIGAKGVVWGVLYTLSPAIEPPIAALGLLLSGGQTLLEFAAIFWRLYPRERVERGLTAPQRAYLAIRLRPVLDALTPLLTVGLAGLTAHYTLSGAYRAWGGWGALTASAMGFCALRMGLSLTRRAAPLPVRTVSLAPSLLAEAQRLGNELGVQVREILVLDGTRTRTANAYALSGGRIALTDYLLAALTERELHAVLAHEIAHLAQRRRLVRLWALLTSVGIGLALVSAPFVERLPRWGLLVLLLALALGMLAPMLWLRQRHEREADAFAVSQYGAEPLASALRKLAAIHPRETRRSGDALHPSLQERLRHLQRFQRRLQN
jgi:Zn-dependent protease with chaperone function